MKAYFFPGLGADESLAPYHLLPGFETKWIRWPKVIGPDWNIFVSDLINGNEIEEGALFLGISFGGLAALRVANLKRPKAIVLIGSLTSSKAISPPFRILAPLVGFLPGFLFNLIWVPRWIIGYFFGIQRQEHLDHFFSMAKGITSAQTKGLVRLALTASADGCGTLFAVHGDKDRILPARYSEPGYLVKGGGHLLTMTHPDEVNGAIMDWVKSRNWT